MTVQLALYKGQGQLGNALIRWWCKRQYSHCELIVDGWCYSSSMMDGGVRRKRIDLDSGNWDVIELPWADAASILRYFFLTEHQRYGVFGLFKSQVLNRNKEFKGSQFCSEWCARALGIPSGGTYSPDTLGKLCGWITSLAP